MDEMLNNIGGASQEPDETAEQTSAEESLQSAPEAICAEESESPAEMSLEGRKLQLEKKISEEIGKQPAQEAQPAASPYAQASYPQNNTPYNAPYAGQYGQQAAYFAQNKPEKAKMPSGAKAYIILISGVLLVFLIAFIMENVRTFNQNGIFGGDLERFLDSDFAYDPFGKLDSDFDEDDETDSEKKGFSWFPFGDSDSNDDIPFPLDTDDVSTDETDSDNDDTDNFTVKEAPDPDTVINSAAAEIKAADQPKDIDSPEYTTRKAYKKAENSVVGIIVYADKEDVGNEIYKSGTGSGIIASKDGYVITNSHVIGDTSECGAEVVTANGDHYAAAIVGFDSRTDLAVLKIDGENLTAAEFVNSDQIEVGQDALAVGYPGGMKYSNSLTRGCVSALNRTVTNSRLGSYIQTDAAINPGNSGGPLLNSAGQVMGIATIKIASTDYEGMGFAIPSNTVIQIANDLIKQGYVSGRVKLGVRILDSKISAKTEGLEVVDILPGSPLLDTDLQIGDVITKFDGKAVKTTSTLYSLLGEHDPGDMVTLTVYRPAKTGSAAKTYEITVKLVADTGE